MPMETLVTMIAPKWIGSTPKRVAMAISIGPRITMMAISSITAASRKKAMLSEASASQRCWMLSAIQCAKREAICSCATRMPKPAETAMMAQTMALVRIELENSRGSIGSVSLRSTNSPTSKA